MKDLNILIPMAGLGNRFKKEGYKNSKPLISINGKPMIQIVLETLGIKGNYIFVINSEIPQVEELKTLLNEQVDNPVIIEIDYLTEGPASTCLLAEKYIDNDNPLVITNCDQIMKWNSDNFIEYLNNDDCDGAVVTYDIITEKNSYVKLNREGYAVEFAEKKVISNHSLNGIHFWRKGKYFIDSAKDMIKEDLRVNNEFYIAPTYNQMINKGFKVRSYEIDKKEHWAVGTPSDLLIYLEHENIQSI